MKHYQTVTATLRSVSSDKEQGQDLPPEDVPAPLVQHSYRLETLSSRIGLSRFTDMPGLHRQDFDDLVSSARERAREDLAHFATQNQYVYGPIEYEIVQDTSGPSPMSWHSVVAWAPAIKNPEPAHMDEVMRHLQQPVKKMQNPLVITQFEPDEEVFRA